MNMSSREMSAQDLVGHRPSPNILVVTNGWPTPSTPSYAVFTMRQVNALRAGGFDVDVEFVNGRDHGPGAYLRRLPFLGRRLRAYDLVHCHHGLSYLLVRLAGGARRVVVSFQNPIEHEFDDLNPVLRRVALALTRMFLRSGRDGVVFKDRLAPEYAGRRLARHIPNGVDMDAFRPGDRAAARAALGLDPGATYLLFVSSKDLRRRQKRYDRFVAVVAAMRARRPDLDVRELVMVDALPQITPLHYQAADVCVMTSDFEGSPNSVKEAMAAELPVVSTAVGNVAEMLAGCAGARVIHGPDPEPDRFCEAIEAVLGVGPGPRAALRERIHDLGLDSGRVTERLRALYADVLAGGPAPDAEALGGRAAPAP